jgi:outer membrane lipoprotein SlyB
MKKPLRAFVMLLLVAFPVGLWAQQAEGSFKPPAGSMPDEDSFKLPAGTTLEVRLMVTLSTKTNQDGDPFTGQIMEPIFARGEEVIPVGSTVEGRVTFLKEPGRVSGRGEMRLLAESITTAKDEKYNIVAALEDAHGAEGATVKDKEGTIKGPGKSTKDAAKQSGIGAGVGAAAGGIAAGGTGALYGAGIGAVAMAIRTLAKRGKDVTLPQGTELTFVISRDSVAQKVPAKNKQEQQAPEGVPEAPK